MSKLPAMMRAVEIKEFGPAEGLTLTERPVPHPVEGEVLVRVSYAGVNRPDVQQRLGGYPPPPGASDIPGLEIAGVIVDIAKDVSNWKIGDKVCALVSGGGYAEYCAAPAVQCLPIPKGFSLEEAASIVETTYTVWANVFTRGKLTKKETLLIHGGSSGIGTTAIQMSNQFGARVFATAGSDKKCATCESIGAELAINYKSSNFVEEIMNVTNNSGVDVILDIVGGSYLQKNLKILCEEGRLVQIAFQETPKVNINLLPIMLNRLSLTGSTLRPQSLGAKARIAKALEERVWPLIEGRKIKPIIDKKFSLKDANQAHKYMETGEHIGKIALVV